MPAVLRPQACPISSATRSRYSVESPPPAPDGVPTHTNVTSVSHTAATGSGCTESRPADTTSAIRSPMRSSTMGVIPSRMNADFVGLGSTPTTTLPLAAKHAAETQPT